MLKINNLSLTIGKKRLLKGVEAKFQRGSMNALIGPNGAGKSTFLRCIANKDLKSSGEVIYGDIDIHSLSTSELSKTLSYMSQFSSDTELSVWEVLALGRRMHSPTGLKENDHKKIEQIAKKMNITSWLQTPLNTLSGGERQKIFILSALLQEPKILLLDEPISHLDPKNQHFMLEFIKHQTIEHNLITIIVLHDVHHALHYASDIVMLKNGNLLDKKPSSKLVEDDIKNLYDMDIEMYEVKKHKFIYYKHTHF